MAGCLFDKRKRTTHYFLITEIMLWNSKERLESHEDIKKCMVTSVNRLKLIDFLNGVGLSEKKLSDYELTYRNDCQYDKKQVIKELNPNTQGYIYVTKHLPEKPINLTLKLDNLVTQGVAKRLHT